MPNIMGFPSHKNPAFLRVHINIVTEPLWEKPCVGVGQPLFSLQQKVGERKYGTETVKDEEQIRKEKSVC
jgi:hypothetical protein